MMNVQENELQPKLSSSFPLNVVVASTVDGAIGNKNSLPWNLPKDLQMFSKITKTVNSPQCKNAVIMGRRTYDSIPSKFKPLPQRLNFVISHSVTPDHITDVQKGVYLMSSLEQVLQKLHADFIETIEQVFIIGGAQIYEEAFKKLNIDYVYLTLVMGANIEYDVICKSVVQLDDYEPIAVSKSFGDKLLSYVFYVYQRKARPTASPTPQKTVTDRFKMYLSEIIQPSNRIQESIVQCCPSVKLADHEEFQYLQLIAKIMSMGQSSDDRTGVGTIRIHGAQMRFSLRETFPLLTTKNVFWRGVVEELLWFIAADTNANHLTEKGVKIWEKNGSREFLDSRGLTQYKVGELGPVYGFQWRHFGAQYRGCEASYENEGVDQLMNCIRLIKEDPTSRRIIMTAWNPVDLPKMALPPCHMMCQFFVTNGELSCLMYQRSADMGLGVPFNIASYSLLCRMIAQVTGLKPGDFIHTIGDAHVYKNHVEPLKQQLTRCPRPFPILSINPDIKHISDFKMSDFTLSGYKPHPTIKMDMAV